MSRENPDLVRMPLRVRAESPRRMEERVCIRYPAAVALLVRGVMRLSPRSRLRQTLVRRSAQVFLEAYNRKDFDSAYSLYHPTSETILPHQFTEMGFEPVARGARAGVAVQRRWHAEWGEFEIEPHEAIDLGDRVLLLGRIRGSGLSSGAGVESEWADLVTLAAGWIVREQYFFDAGEALAAVGLKK